MNKIIQNWPTFQLRLYTEPTISSSSLDKGTSNMNNQNNGGKCKRLFGLLHIDMELLCESNYCYDY